ncbi:MAG: SCP2 sterol-binding domain-containing protein [Candidatus Lokiarchaeota archaeon]|nr:SCP2 sterol-binding domain-containing protein [Candidatus Lokiarchaeota archaeon]MCK4480200.1 SCP2 sterol-binding domain-containing protein [Candidatus Lokiarchaeota archaeon]MCK4780927.1 SCP2 sterol-binding domain-containing protein [Candidatus Lokiarchaeota archaeon]
MTEFKNFEECLEEIKNRYNDNEKVRKKLAKYDDPIQMTFLDTDRKVLILVNKDEGIEIKDNTGADTAPVKIEFTGQQVIIDLFNKDLGAVKAYSDGKIKIIEGNMRSLMKLRSLMF